VVRNKSGLARLEQPLDPIGTCSNKVGVSGTINKVFTDAKGRKIQVKGCIGAAENVIAASMGLDVSTFSDISKVTTGIISGTTVLVGAGVGMTPKPGSRANSRASTTSPQRRQRFKT
jgi:hypothetical protein